MTNQPHHEQARSKDVDDAGVNADASAVLLPLVRLLARAAAREYARQQKEASK